MNPKERWIAFHVGCVVGLRERLAAEIDPHSRQQVQADLDLNRRELALLLQESKSERTRPILALTAVAGESADQIYWDHGCGD